MNTWMATKIEARSIARRVGIVKLLHSFQHIARRDRGYEVKFGHALRAAVHEGDTVWDVGANLGLYTRLFSDWVGPDGNVVAFEPVPSCFEALRKATEQCANVTILNLGLSDGPALLPMHLADDPKGATHTFAAHQKAVAEVVELPVYPGDEVRQSHNLPIPNVLKIDVEGFEPEVLRGLDATLRESACRTVLCEVHFGLLESRGRKFAPEEIARDLTRKGFSVTWIDASHLGAYREP